MTKYFLHLVLFLAALSASEYAVAQGQDSTPAERDMMVIAEMLPGTYDNREQVYFDQRGGVPDSSRHGRLNIVVEKVELPAFGPYVFFIRLARDNNLDEPTDVLLGALSTDKSDPARVRMRVHILADKTKYANAHLNPKLLVGLTPATVPNDPGCDIFWHREAGQMRASTEPGSCIIDRGEQTWIGETQIMLAPNSLWVLDLARNEKGEIVSGMLDAVFHKLNRSREFTCHADMPGVSGGRDEPFERYGPFPTVDQGGEVIFMTKEDQPREMHVSLRNVDWQINNETGAFTRDVLVMYLYSKKADGKIESYGYSFTEPTVTRTGLNLGWIMVQCYMTSNRDGRPEF